MSEGHVNLVVRVDRVVSDSDGYCDLHDEVGANYSVYEVEGPMSWYRDMICADVTVLPESPDAVCKLKKLVYYDFNNNRSGPYNNEKYSELEKALAESCTVRLLIDANKINQDLLKKQKYAEEQDSQIADLYGKPLIVDQKGIGAEIRASMIEANSKPFSMDSEIVDLEYVKSIETVG